VIRLLPATYFRVRFVTSAGEPITSPRVLRQSFDGSGNVISEPLNARVADQIDGDGTVTIGPLPRGVTMMALNTPPFAHTRLPDLPVTGEETLLDHGTIAVQPGAVLHIDVVDAAGAPVPRHEVLLEDALPFSPLTFPPVRTNAQGRATFDRLAQGRYRVRTRAIGQCGNRPLWVARLVSLSGNGNLQTRIVVGGSATFRVTSSLGPLRATEVSASPDSGAPALPAWVRERSGMWPFSARPLRLFTFESSCSGVTDENGRVTFTAFPPGAAQVDVRLLNSTSAHRVAVPIDGHEIPIEIADGFFPLRVISSATGAAIAGAAITWTAGGARVEARASGSGEALLEGVSAAPGTLAIRAPGFQPGEMKLLQPLAFLQEFALVPAPAAHMQARIVSDSGEPVADAVVEVSSENPFEESVVAATDAKGLVTFSELPPGALRLAAAADGFVSSETSVSEDARSGVVVTLARGYRVNAIVELTAAAFGLYSIRVVDGVGATIDRLLDSGSDRAVASRGRVSLGPLPPGVYVIELNGAGDHFEQRVRVVDRNVDVTFR
jgi:Carboxypeptidase regulatory-like domain